MLDLQLEALLKAAQAAGVPDLADLPPPVAREVYRQICAAGNRPPADVRVHELQAPVPMRVYTPHATPQQKPHALVVYYHGGGCVLGDVAAYDSVARQLCVDSGAVVVSVDYRLAPEHPFPAAADDAWTALVWAAEHASDLGADPKRLAVAGDSSGAMLSTVVALRARDAGGPAIRMQALLYPPAAGGHGDYESRRTFADGPTLTSRMMAFFNTHAFGGEGRAPDWRGAPLLAPSLAGLPPALLLVAGLDPLRDEALAFGAALLAAGTPAQIVEYPTLAHGFITMAGAVGIARLAQQQFGRALRDGTA
jgi:acetyl esterase